MKNSYRARLRLSRAEYLDALKGRSVIQTSGGGNNCSEVTASQGDSAKPKRSWWDRLRGR